jgi:hypothetical protein
MPAAWAILVALLWIAVVGLAVLVLGLHARLGRMDGLVPALTRVRGPAPPVGAALRTMPAYELLDDAVGTDPALLLFLSPTCAPCLELGAALETGALDTGADQRVRVIVVTAEADRDIYHPQGAIDQVIDDPGNQLGDALGAVATPFGIALDRAGIVRRVSFISNLAEVKEFISAAEALPSLAVIGSA